MQRTEKTLEPKIFIDVPYFAEALCRTAEFTRGKIGRHNSDGSTYQGAPPTEEELRRAWQVVRHSVMRRWVRDHPMTRPPAWWRYSAPEPRDEADESEGEYLRRHGLLEPGEHVPRPGRYCGDPGEIN